MSTRTSVVHREHKEEDGLELLQHDGRGAAAAVADGCDPLLTGLHVQRQYVRYSRTGHPSQHNTKLIHVLSEFSIQKIAAA